MCPVSRCSICHTLIQPGEETTRCRECEQDYHRSCWTEIGGCGTYGCKAAAVADKPPPPVLVGGGWGDTKQCPACGLVIGSSLLGCRCGARFPYADPMSPAEYEVHRDRERRVASTKAILVVLFILSLLGLPAPLTGLIAGGLAFARRKVLAGAYGTYLAIGYGSAALGLVYGLIILLATLGA
jgi:hypothetical protein